MANQETSTADIGSAFDLLGKSFDIVKQNWQVFLFVNILTILGSLSALAPVSSDEDSANVSALESGISGLSGLEIGLVASLGLIFILGFLIVNAYFFVMQQILITKASDGQKLTAGQIFNEANKRLFRMILLFLLGGLIIGLGLILLIVPGLIAFARIVMAPYVMVDKNLGVMDSLKESNRLSKKYSGKVWAAIGVSILIGIGVALVDIVPFAGQIAGALITIAFSLVMALRYFQLKKLDSNSEAVAPPPAVASPPVSPAVS
jgi:hypothetical protein